MHTKFVHKLLTSHTFIHLVMEKVFVAIVRFCMMHENFFFVKPIYKMQGMSMVLKNTTKNLTDDLICTSFSYIIQKYERNSNRIIGV